MATNGPGRRDSRGDYWPCPLASLIRPDTTRYDPATTGSQEVRGFKSLRLHLLFQRVRGLLGRDGDPTMSRLVTRSCSAGPSVRVKLVPIDQGARLARSGHHRRQAEAAQD